MKKLVWLIMCLFLVSIPLVMADWGLETHRYFAKQVCNSSSMTGCESCTAELLDGAVYPDVVLKNSIDQHIFHQCVNANEIWCDPGKICQSCFEGEISDQIGIDRMNEALARAKTSDGCDRWKQIGIAGHYFFETRLYWNNVKGETDFCSNTYTQDIEGQIEDHLTVFNTTRCGVSVSQENVTEWAIEFVGIAGESLPASVASNPPTSSDEYTDVQDATTTSRASTPPTSDKWYVNMWQSFRGSVGGILDNWGWGAYAGIVAGFVLILGIWILWSMIFRRRRR